MYFENIENLKDEAFRRFTGIKKATFNKMTLILKQADQLKKIKGGRKNKLTMENMLLMFLEYIREYRTYFHIGKSFGISESSAYKNIRWIESVLIKDPIFSLPGKKALLKSDNQYDIVCIDATETPVECPKKNKNTFILEKRKNLR